MILTIQQLARAVATALEDEVLPSFEPRSWPASRIRSSLGLLQLIIDQAEKEQHVLVEGNRLICDFLNSVKDGDPVQSAGTAQEGADMPALRGESQRLRARLSELIRASHGKVDADGVRPALHRLLRELELLEKPIYDEAIRFLPM